MLMLRQIGCALLSAFAGTLFYKKSFRQSEIPLVLHTIALAVAVRFLDLTTTSLFCFSTTYVLLDSQRREMVWTVVRTTKPSMFLTLFMLFVDVEFNLGAMMGTLLFDLHPSSTLWIRIRIGCAAVIQFVRHPLWVKTMLQEPRSHMGPVFIASLAQLAVRLPTSDARSGFMALATASAFAAGTLFRPDNSAVSGLLRESTSSQRKTFHRVLMTAAFAIFLLDCACEFSLPTVGAQAAAAVAMPQCNNSCEAVFFPTPTM